MENFEEEAEDKYYPPMELFIKEDKGICELVQRGIGGKLAGAGRYCPTEEKTVHEFASYVIDHVLGDSPANNG
jgi:hypothetical protein